MQTLELFYEVERVKSKDSWPPFIFDVYDYDSQVVGDSRDYMGRSIIKATDCAMIDEELINEHEGDELAAIKTVTPKWHAFRFAPGEPKCGEVLVCFSSVAVDYNYLVSPQIFNLNSIVKTKEHKVELLILGLRDLASPGILPVKKAFIEFGLKSMMPPGTSNLKNIKTQPSAPGPNPTLNTTLMFQIPLPTDSLFCPNMMCTVYDNIYSGLVQPVIGVFTLPIGKLMDDLYIENEKELNKINEICDELQKIEAEEVPNVPDYSDRKPLDIAAAVVSKKVADAGGNINDSVDSDEENHFAVQDTDVPNFSMNELDKKAIQKDKKKIAKAVKGTDNASEYSQSFGVNEDKAEYIDEAKEVDQLTKIKTMKSNLLDQVHKMDLEA